MQNRCTGFAKQRVSQDESGELWVFGEELWLGVELWDFGETVATVLLRSSRHDFQFW